MTKRKKEKLISEAVKAATEMQHELLIFMQGIAQWFERHPELRESSLPHVHSVRCRLKDPGHLHEKIERKWDDSNPITAANIFQEVTDLAGVRVLHLHQSQFEHIHNCIEKKLQSQDWVLHEPPKCYTWDPESSKFFESLGLSCSVKETFYTSVHYVVRPRQDSLVSCEIQIRTLFEEIWGEVDHTLNYPAPAISNSCREQLKVLAKLVGAGSRLVDSIFRSAGPTEV